MLGDSAVLGEAASSGDAVAVAPVAASATAAAAAATINTTHEGAVSAAATAAGVGGSNSGDEDRARSEDGERSFGGNRWPRQETLALLKIRSDMDATFRDASVKGPLWEEVSRKLGKLGYHRSAKKCKEKFENVYKYHKRTKEGRSGKSEGKTYRFFDQLQAFESQYPSIQSSRAEEAVPHVTTVSSTTTSTLAIPMAQGIVPPPPSINLTIPSFSPTVFAPSTANPTIPSSFPNIPTDFLSSYTSSSTSSDEMLQGSRKRKWKDFFQRLMKRVIEKQEDLQKRFFQAIEKRENERMVREEAWRMQEVARINREREILAQERSIAAAKDAAVMAFLHKIAEQQNLGQAFNNINLPQPQLQPQQAVPPPVQQVAIQQHSQPQPQVGPPALLPLAPQTLPQQQVTSMEITKTTDNGDNFMAASSSRWPKVEVEALIKLRTDLDAKYQDNGPKGPLWEEISSAMRKIGYNRSAKRCKEKWENINKYFKKVKESNKKRPEDSKTCPYFHQLDALYREKNKLDNNPTSSANQLKPPPENMNMMTPLMVRPEQQWPPPQNTGTGPDVTVEEAENDTTNRHNEDNDGEDEEDRDGDEDDEEDEGGDNYEIVASKPASVGAGAAAE